ncbi:hypothetical protein NIES2111_38320 [Nostoc sp. NIES-2111]|nr:hypothetical protein NIES2111_38320 [Nostoc sp. NIES-2111]
MTDSQKNITTAICWCLAWGDKRKPKFTEFNLTHQQMLEALRTGEGLPEDIQNLVKQVQELQGEEFPDTLEKLKNLPNKYPQYWNAEIGLVYGGATKIKQYVFEAAKLPDIRGASALLDRINLVDLPAFFHCETSDEYRQCKDAKEYCEDVRTEWLDIDENFPGLSQALIPELIIYSTGGNILAFCPPAFIDDLANAIEKRYTEETLTANSCAVGEKFKLLEIKFGLLPDKITDETFWIEECVKHWNNNELIRAYYEQPNTSPKAAFKERKTFNELAGKLASLFNQRRNGNSLPGRDRPLRCYPPMFETHPYIVRDEGDRRSAIMQARELPNEPWFSEASARKRLVGQISKSDKLRNWYDKAGFTWELGENAIVSWVSKFADFLYATPHKYYGKIRSENIQPHRVKEANSVREIGDASTPKGFVAYIYADGNNMGGYIQKKIKSPEEYRNFSQHISEATEKSVYIALTEHLKPHKLNPNLQAERNSKEEVWIHPFEILTIGGDDIMLIVPANKALAIAKTIGEEFEKILLNKGRDYQSAKVYNPENVHRYHTKTQNNYNRQCVLSISTGVLITAEDTPIYYAEKLTSQLLKSAKKRAKDLKENDYYGGTVDFLVMKSVTMISSNIGEFRANGLTKTINGQQKLKFYATPYTLHELGGLLATGKALKEAEFPRSQLYQIRSFLERGKQTAILNYRYFRVRLSDKNAQKLLKDEFEEVWCKPKEENNGGNLAPWMSLKEKKEELKDKDKVTYETIWRELVDLYPFLETSQDKSNSATAQQKVSQP